MLGDSRRSASKNPLAGLRGQAGRWGGGLRDVPKGIQRAPQDVGVPRGLFILHEGLLKGQRLPRVQTA
jgi:hypothetical protein